MTGPARRRRGQVPGERERRTGLLVALVLGQKVRRAGERIVQVRAAAQLADDRGQGAGGELAGRVTVRVPGSGRGRVEDPLGREVLRQQPERRDPHHAAAPLRVVDRLIAVLRDPVATLASLGQRAQTGVARRAARVQPLLAQQPAVLLAARSRQVLGIQPAVVRMLNDGHGEADPAVGPDARPDQALDREQGHLGVVGDRPRWPPTGDERPQTRPGTSRRSTARPRTPPARRVRPRSRRPANTHSPRTLSPRPSSPMPSHAQDRIRGGVSATSKTGSGASSRGARCFYGRCYTANRSLKERTMTTAFRRTAGRLAVAALATTALTGAAIAGGQAAMASTSCQDSRSPRPSTPSSPSAPAPPRTTRPATELISLSSLSRLFPR